jgi:hypothetical protein
MPLKNTWLLLAIALVLPLSGCGERSGSVPEVPASEVTAQVPELDAVHEIMQPLWHDAFPAKDFAAIQEMVPQFEPLLTALGAADLPGILREKQASWDEGKGRLMESFQGLKAAASSGNQAEMLAYAEAFHGNYEGMVRIIRPVIPELEAFHQHLYGLYHHYGPGYDLEKIRQAAKEMAAAIPPLQAAQIPERLAGHQAHFEMVVEALGESVGALMASLQAPNKAEVEAAIEAVHDAYGEVEGIFNEGSDG